MQRFSYEILTYIIQQLNICSFVRSKTFYSKERHFSESKMQIIFLKMLTPYSTMLMNQSINELIMKEKFS